MGYFQSIKLNNFRNFTNFEIDFDPKCNVLVGVNGSGKTNILESISLFEKGRGFRKDNLNNFINYTTKQDNFSVSSIFNEKNTKINLFLFNQINENNSLKKILVNNNASRDSLKYFENLFSLIYFMPEMERLFLNSPLMRRNFFDRLIYNSDKNYNKLINNYKKNIFERHKVLKNYKYDNEWIIYLEKKIVDLGIEIYKKRFKHLSFINSNLKDLYIFKNNFFNISLFIKDDLVRNIDDLNKIYEQYVATLQNIRDFDTVVGGCKIGPHKSDILARSVENNFNVNQFSTGQQKTVILLIILAQCKYLINQTKINPIIFFDEVCSHLDKDNRELLLHIIETLNVQTFITGTEKNFFSFLSTKVSYCNII